MRVTFPRCPIPTCKGKRMGRIYVREAHSFKGVGWRCPRCGWLIGDAKDKYMD